MRTEVAIYLPAGCTPESRRSFLMETEADLSRHTWVDPMSLHHTCRGSDWSPCVAHPSSSSAWSPGAAARWAEPHINTSPPACEMLPEFAALNVESRKSKSRGKWTAVLASTVRGWLFRIMVGGVRRCGHHPVSDHPRNPSPQFHLPKVCDETLAEYTFCSRRKDARNVNPTYYFQIQARLFPTFSQFQTAPLSPLLDGFRVSFDLRQETSRCARPARVLYNSVA